MTNNQYENYIELLDSDVSDLKLLSQISYDLCYKKDLLARQVLETKEFSYNDINKKINKEALIFLRLAIKLETIANIKMEKIDLLNKYAQIERAGTSIFNRKNNTNEEEKQKILNRLNELNEIYFDTSSLMSSLKLLSGYKKSEIEKINHLLTNSWNQLKINETEKQKIQGETIKNRAGVYELSTRMKNIEQENIELNLAIKKYSNALLSKQNEFYDINKEEIIADSLFKLLQVVKQNKAIELPSEVIFYYTVQVGLYRYPVAIDIFNNVKPLFNKVLEDSTNCYSVGVYSSLKQAEQAKKIIRELGNSDAFITAYYNSKRISIDEALEYEDSMQTKYPIANTMPFVNSPFDN